MSPKVFIVTGASKGLGAAITQRLLSQSHKVVLAARSQELLEVVKRAHPDQVQYVAGDLTDSSVTFSHDVACIAKVEHADPV